MTRFRRLLSTNRKKSLILLITIFLFAFVNYQNLLNEIQKNSFERTNDSACKAQLNCNSIPFLRYVLNETLGLNNVHTDSKKTNPCLATTFIQLDKELREKINNSKSLKYFNSTQGYRVSVPKWQVNMRQAKKTEKFFLSTVVRLRLYPEDKARWSPKELKQWLHYQLWAGAQHIYICNHFLNETEKIETHLQKYVKLGLITIIPWNNIKAVPGSASYASDNADNQIACYNHVLKLYGQDSEWQYNFDMDENPFVPGDYCEGFLTRFLQRMHKLKPRIAEFRVQNYVLQGQGDRSRDIFYDRINRISPSPYNGNVKPIYRISLTNEAGMHGAKTNGLTEIPHPSQLKMLHYWGARKQNWGPDSQKMLRSTRLFNDVRDSLAVSIRHSMVAFGDFDAFSSTTGP